MKKHLLTIIGVVVLMGAGFFALNSYLYSEKQSREESINTQSTYTSEAYGFSFDYRAGEDGYTLLEVVPSSQDDADLKHIVVLMQKADYDALQAVPQDTLREGPPTINVAVYDNPQNVPVGEWIDAHPSAVNRDLVLGAITEDTIASEPALRMKTDGLYVTNVALVSHGGRLYLFTGGFIDENSPLAHDFEPLLSSIEWK